MQPQAAITHDIMPAMLPIPARAPELRPEPLFLSSLLPLEAGGGELVPVLALVPEVVVAAASAVGAVSSVPQFSWPTHSQVITPPDRTHAVPARQYCPFEQHEASAGIQL